jgi:hypothetical protein
LWTGCKRNEYGGFAIKVDGKWKHVYPHRFSYAMHKEIPKGMTVDHLCSNKMCVNPEHLEIVSIWENRRRAIEGDPIKYLGKIGRLGARARWG